MPRDMRLSAKRWSAALKHTPPGDYAWITRSEVEDRLKGAGRRISR